MAVTRPTSIRQIPRRPTLLLTGECAAGRSHVRINGKLVKLTHREFTALCRLALGVREKQPQVEVARETIRLLRAAINAQAGNDLGWALTKSASKQCYVLDVPRGRVRVNATFPALPATALAEDIQFALLRSFGRE